jgi:hypothetical protein
MALGQRKPHRAINANYEVFAPSAGVTAFAREAALFVALAVWRCQRRPDGVPDRGGGDALRGAAQPLPRDRDPERQSDLFRGQQGPPLDDDRGGRADHRHAALTRGDIGGPKRMKTGRCVRCPRANGAPLLGSRLMGKDSGGRWRLRTAKPPYRRRSQPECSDSSPGPPGGSC